VICFRLHAWRAFLGFSLFLIFFSSCASEIVAAYTKDEASRSIQWADEAVSSAFEAVLEAEAAGANVSELIMKLNEAVGFLAEASVLVENGEFGRIIEVTNRSVDIAKDVEAEASSLRVSALSHRDFVFKVSLVGSIGGVLSFLFLMFFLWRRFRGFYARRILSLRPEVASDVEA